MKNILFTTLAIFALCFNGLYAQDPALGNPAFSPNPLPIGSDGNMSFTFGNNSVFGAIPASSGLEIKVELGNVIPSAPTGEGAAFFTWTPSVLNETTTYIGVLNQDVPLGTFAKEINFPVEVFSAPLVAVNMDRTAINVNFTNVNLVPGGLNDTGNDSAVFFNFIGPPQAVPVELISFTGRPINEGNLLNWRTASELNNAGFEVEKSANGRDWDMIGWVEGKGTTQIENSYDLLDREPYLGDNYYRLKQIDYDGQFEYSNIINIENKVSDVVVQVLPNPSPGDVKVSVMNPNKDKMQITLFDSAGQLIFKTEVLEGLEMWKKKFSLSQKEMYFLSVQIGEEIFTEKILIIDRA